MDLKKLGEKWKISLKRYKYAGIILLVGLALMLLPSFGTKEKAAVSPVTAKEEVPLSEQLAQILCNVQGAGKVEVMLNFGQGAKTIYQMDLDESETENGHTNKAQTITLTDAQRNQYGLVQQVNPPVYLGAVVVCQGADNPSVKLSIVEAVSKITGLNANQICVLKMK